MAKRKCPNCGAALSGIETVATCTRCAMLAAQHSRSATTSDQSLLHLGGSVHRLLVHGRDRADGWLRVVFQPSGDISYKWRYTHGPHSGKYVFFVATELRPFSFGFTGIHEQLLRVEEGLLKPSPDIWK